MLPTGESRSICRRDRQTDGSTDGRQTVTLRFPLDAARVLNVITLNFAVRVRFCLMGMCSNVAEGTDYFVGADENLRAPDCIADRPQTTSFVSGFCNLEAY